MKFIPHDYQAYAIDRAIRESKLGLFLDMGLGKTVITLTAIEHLIYETYDVDRVLIIAPLQTARNTWTDEAAKWDHLKDLRISLVLGSAAERKRALTADADIYVINRENVQWLCEYYEKSWPFDMLVVDELSSFKSAKAKRFRALRKKLPYFRRVVGLTGTPASNGYIDLWPEVYLLDRGKRLGKTLGAYRDTYFRPGRQKNHVVYEWLLRSGAKELIDRKLSDLCVSMAALDHLQMPERIESNVYVSMDTSERKVYDQFARDHVLPDKDIYGLSAAAVQNKLLQMAGGFAYDDTGTVHIIHERKLDALSELVEAAQGKPLLVYYSFVADRDRILERFSGAQLLTGDAVVRWNRGEISMLLAHPASAGHGLNLQAGGSNIVWYGLPWSLELYQQANARLYRQGQKNTVCIFHILTKDTHDEDVLAALRDKNTTQEQLLKALKARIKQWRD